MLIVNFSAYVPGNDAMRARFEEADIAIVGNPMGSFIAKHPDEARIRTAATAQELKKAVVVEMGDD